MKKLSLFAILLVALVAPGCSWFKHGKTAAPAATAPKTIVTPDMSLAAKVVSVNTVGRFVILNFPADKMPKVGQTMFLYRAGMKVAEVKIAGPQQENNIVADLVSGDPQVGDMVRSD
jgi:hypothetical protein